MTTWLEMSLDSFAAAKQLHQAGRARSAASRAYFAAYAGAVSQLPSSTSFGNERPNPSHGQIVQMVQHNLPPQKYSEQSRRNLSRLIRALQRGRIVADYGSGLTIDQSAALTSVRDAARVLNLLEVN